jgi:MFS family permease
MIGELVPGGIGMMTHQSGAADDSPMPSSERVQRLVLYDALAHEAMGILTTGVFLAGMAVALGASNFAIGVLAAVPFIAQLLQIPAVFVIERWRSRRRVTVLSSGIGRCFLLASAAAPFLGPDAAVEALIATLAIHQAMAAVSGCAWNSWMRDLVPATEYGRFFGRRTAVTLAVSITLAFLGSVLIDCWKRYLPGDPVFAYSCLFTLSACIGLWGVYLLYLTPEPAIIRQDPQTRFHHLLTAPLRDVNFRRLVLFLSTWNFAVNLAAPFFTVYMLKTLHYEMTTIIVFTLASQLSNLASLEIWGALIDRFSNKAVLGVTAPLFLACMAGWTLTGLPWGQSMIFILLLGLHVLSGASTAGVALASGNIAMKLSPQGAATAYLAANSVITASCAAAAPILGGLAADFFAAHELSLSFTWAGAERDVTVELLKLRSWTFFFALACIFGIYSLHRLSFVEEQAGTSDPLLLRDLIAEARRSIRSLSSAAGLLRVVRLPVWLRSGDDRQGAADQLPTCVKRGMDSGGKEL